MIRLNLIVEGQTEEAFVHRLLEVPLAEKNVAVAVRCAETGRDKRRHKIYRGGILNYPRLKRDLSRWMKEDQKADVRFSTMIDLYALPEDFPGFRESKAISDRLRRVVALETAMAQDIPDSRFIPYIQLHEFEALLLAEPIHFDEEFLERKGAYKALEAAVVACGGPELVNDGETTAPSKRIIAVIPEYEGRKVSAGPNIAAHIGLPTIRSRCSHFDKWLARLESLAVHS